MKLDRIIDTEINENTVRERLATFFVKAGYVQMTSQPHLSFRRGSGLGSLVSFSPKGWKTKAFINILPGPSPQTQITVTLDINTTGQLVTESERRFWQTELDDLEKAIQTGNVEVSAGVKQAQLALKLNLILTGFIIILAIVTGLMFDSRIAGYIGGTVGLVLGFFAQHWLFKLRVDSSS